MRTMWFILQKEFIQIFRNRIMLILIFMLPVVMLVILVHAATLEIRDLDLIVVDRDLSQISGKLTGHFEGSPFFKIRKRGFSTEKAKKEMLKGEADAIIFIPEGFEKKLVRENTGELQILINSVNATVAGLTNYYATSIVAGFNRDIRLELPGGGQTERMRNIRIIPGYWYNPDLNYKVFMVPGILVILITIVGMFLSAINLVREKELGTAEQINVTPIRKYQFITGKMLPFWLISMFDLGFGLLIGRLLFGLPVVGSLGNLFAFASVYLLVVMSFGLFMSAISNTQQQVMFLTFFFMVTFILMSGIFTPVESMPDWAIRINIINPIAYFMKAIRMILLKGSGLSDLRSEMLFLLVYGLIILSLATWRYRKTA